ncbi:Hypothetical protein D9617_10g074310 [Elsinoe fawcettii]|nr:Hypothetical protein D9617_10g074310 [Elsinoe fawcettii]
MAGSKEPKSKRIKREPVDVDKPARNQSTTSKTRDRARKDDPPFDAKKLASDQARTDALEDLVRQIKGLQPGPRLGLIGNGSVTSEQLLATLDHHPLRHTASFAFLQFLWSKLSLPNNTRVATRDWLEEAEDTNARQRYSTRVSLEGRAMLNTLPRLRRPQIRSQPWVPSFRDSWYIDSFFATTRYREVGNIRVRAPPEGAATESQMLALHLCSAINHTIRRLSTLNAAMPAIYTLISWLPKEAPMMMQDTAYLCTFAAMLMLDVHHRPTAAMEMLDRARMTLDPERSPCIRPSPKQQFPWLEMLHYIVECDLPTTLDECQLEKRDHLLRNDPWRLAPFITTWQPPKPADIKEQGIRFHFIERVFFLRTIKNSILSSVYALEKASWSAEEDGQTIFYHRQRLGRWYQDLPPYCRFPTDLRSFGNPDLPLTHFVSDIDGVLSSPILMVTARTRLAVLFVPSSVEPAHPLYGH